MLKLAKKDMKLLLSKKSGVLLMLLGLPLLFFLIADERHGNNIVIIYLLTCLTSVLSFNYDNAVDKDQKIFLSLPVTRKEIIYSKYIMIPIYLVFYVILISLYGVVLNFLNISNNLSTSMHENVGLFVLISIVLGISLPLYFSLSTNFARGISYFIIIFTNNMWVSNFGKGNAFNGRLFTYSGGIWAVVLGVFILMVSTGISIILYNEVDL